MVSGMRSSSINRRSRFLIRIHQDNDLPWNWNWNLAFVPSPEYLALACRFRPPDECLVHIHAHVMGHLECGQVGSALKDRWLCATSKVARGGAANGSRVDASISEH